MDRINLSPYFFSPERSGAIAQQTEEFIRAKGYDSEISKLGWAYHYLLALIPESTETFFSGKSFPFFESVEELQISLHLSCFGFYKQAIASLRSSLEVGLLSVYWNLNDAGHIAIKRWLHSREDTPRKLWKKLFHHPNFKKFQQIYDLESRLERLAVLHNYVHTKGHKFSNKFGRSFKGNQPTFEPEIFVEWFEYFKEVVTVTIICHLVKYPLGTVRFPYHKKFPIEIPMFGGLEEYQIDKMEEVVGNDIFAKIAQIATNDPHVISTLEWVNLLPDLSEEEIEEAWIEHEQNEIRLFGVQNWLKNRQVMENVAHDISTWREETERLLKWANENGFK
jgi:hypothetical protein